MLTLPFILFSGKPTSLIKSNYLTFIDSLHEEEEIVKNILPWSGPKGKKVNSHDISIKKWIIGQCSRFGPQNVIMAVNFLQDFKILACENYFQMLVKFRFSKKPTHVFEISHLLCCLLSKHQSKLEISSNFCDLLGKLEL